MTQAYDLGISRWQPEGQTFKVILSCVVKFKANLGYTRPYFKNNLRNETKQKKGEKIKRKRREIGPEVGGVELGVMSERQIGPGGTYVTFGPDGWQMARTCRVTAEVSGLLLVGGPLTTE